MRNDQELVLQTLLRLYGKLQVTWGDLLFVGRRLCDDKECCLRVAEEVTKSSELRPSRVYYGRHRLLELSHQSDRLQHDPTVVAAFCRLNDMYLIRDPTVVASLCRLDEKTPS